VVGSRAFGHERGLDGCFASPPASSTDDAGVFFGRAAGKKRTPRCAGSSSKGLLVGDVRSTDASGFRGRPDLTRHRRRVLVGHDLFRDLSAVDRDFTRKLERESDTVALDHRHPDDTKRRRGISDDDFLTFAAGDDEHDQGLLPADHPGRGSTGTLVPRPLKGGCRDRSARYSLAERRRLQKSGSVDLPFVRDLDESSLGGHDLGHFGDSTAQISRDSVAKRHFARRTSDAGPEKADLDDAFFGDLKELEVPSVFLDRRPNEGQNRLHSRLQGFGWRLGHG
jgi:hypothetical protein